MTTAPDAPPVPRRRDVWPGSDPKLSGSVKRTQRPPLTTARKDELAPWCLSGPKLASGPLKMSR